MSTQNRTSRYPALRISLIYLAFSTLWILLSDWITIELFGDLSGFSQAQTLKGMAFVIFTTLLLYLLVWIEESRKQEIREKEMNAVQELHVTQTRLNHIIDASPAVIYALAAGVEPDSGFSIRYLSGNARKVTGYCLEEWETAPDFWLQHIHHDDRQKVMEAQQVLMQEGALRHQYRFLHSDGQYRWIDDQLTLEHDKDGRLTGITGIWLDITDQKTAETEIKQRLELQEQLAKIAQSVPGIICSFRLRPDNTSCMPYASPMINDIYGLQPEDVAEDSTPLYANMHPDDAARVADSVQTSARSMSPWNAEFRYLHPSKGERWIEGHSMPQKEKDGSILWHGFIMDITESKLAEKRLAETEQRWEFAIDGSDLGLWDWNVPAGTVFFSSRWKSMLGFTEDEISNQLSEWADRVHPDDMPNVMANVERHFRGETKFYTNEHRVLCKDGSYKWIMDRGKVMEHTPEGKPLRMIGTHTDITALKQSEETLALNARVFEQSAEGIVICGPDKRILSVNHAFTDITGYSAEAVIGQNPGIIKSGRHDADFYRDMWRQIDQTGRWQGEIWNRRKDGEVYPEWLSINAATDREGRVTHYFGLFSDITQNKLAEEHISHLAHYDALTDLPNRTLLKDRADHAVIHANRDKESLVMMFLDLDRFKNVNDSLGHPVGDQLLVEVAKRLKSQVREEDTVSRLGGDEFILLLPDTKAEGATHVAGKLAKAISAPYLIAGHELNITPSIGIALYPVDGHDFESMLQCADSAMYRAKQQGRNTFRFYTAEMHLHASRMLQLENALRRALERQELMVYYQPQTDIKSQRITGCEALLRWKHPDFGMVSPADFIPIAEESGLILPIGEWVLRTAVTQNKRWQESGLPPLVMAVNLSAVQFRQVNLNHLVKQVLNEIQLKPAFLELELTESITMDDPEAAIGIMERLHKQGIKLSIDDFGTGYSSLSYLKRFSIHKLKIDQSFVREVTSDPDSEAIVTAVIGLANSLGLQTIAEGVETEPQMELLRNKGCDEIQGYLIGKPMPAHEFETLVRKNMTVDI